MTSAPGVNIIQLFFFIFNAASKYSRQFLPGLFIVAKKDMKLHPLKAQENSAGKPMNIKLN